MSSAVRTRLRSSSVPAQRNEFVLKVYSLWLAEPEHARAGSDAGDGEGLGADDDLVGLAGRA